MKLKNGLLIAIEGVDGSGKSSLARNISSALETEYSTVLTNEPGGTELGKEIKKILLQQHGPVTPKTEFLLFAADRAQHFNDLILPRLTEGNIVISDRMGDSSICYQGYGRGLDIEMIKKINHWATQGKKADLTFFLEIDIEEAFKRIKGRKLDLTNFEEKEFMKKVQAGFKEIYKNDESVKIIDATLTEKELTAKALKVIYERLNEN